MAKVTLIHSQERAEVWSRLLVRNSDLFADDPTLAASPYTVQSEVSLDAVREFISALEGQRVTIKNDNISGLSRLCDEFRFQDLATRLSHFRESALEERMDRLAVLVERVAVPRSAAETVTGRALPQLEADMNQFKEEVAASVSVLEERMQQRDQEIAALQTELLRQRHSQEALLGRVARLEAEVPAVKTAPTPPPSPVSTPPAQSVPPPRPSPPGPWNSVIVSAFPAIFAEFRSKLFSLLWRGSRDRCYASDFHRHCDGHANTLTVMLDTKGNIFGGFTPVEWESQK
jgi:hypothetical protein